MLFPHPKGKNYSLRPVKCPLFTPRVVLQLYHHNNLRHTWLTNIVEKPIPFCKAFRPRSNILVHMNLQHSQAQPYDICKRVISITQILYKWNITLGPVCIRTQDLPISKQYIFFNTQILNWLKSNSTILLYYLFTIVQY